MKIRNGYYIHKNRYLPRVSSILNSAGSSDGLIYWGARQGGYGVIWGLSKINDYKKLKEKLSSTSCIEWASEQAVKALAVERDRVTSFGSNVHKVIECKLKQIDYSIESFTQDEKIALKSFDDFYAEINFDPISIEASVYSFKHSFAGTLDLVAEVNADQAAALSSYLKRSSDPVEPGLLICDFKTGSFYERSMGVQLAAYAQAYEETYKRKCTGGLVINIQRKNPEEVKCFFYSREYLDKAFSDGFVPAVQIWRYFDSPKWYQKHLKENENEQMENS